MQNQYIGYGIRGIYKVADYALRWGMGHDTAQYRYRVLMFLGQHGLPATQDAFDVSRRTLYGWKKQYQQGGLTGLTPKSKAPRHCRRRRWPVAITVEIRRLRGQYPNLGKEKLYPFLQSYCLAKGMDCPGISTIGRLIADAPDKMRHAPLKLRKV